MLHSPYVKQLFFVKINGNLVKKQKHLLQISVRELYNDMMLSSSEGGFSGARIITGNICIENTSHKKYIPNFIKPMSTKNNVS